MSIGWIWRGRRLRRRSMIMGACGLFRRSRMRMVLGDGDGIGVSFLWERVRGLCVHAGKVSIMARRACLCFRVLLSLSLTRSFS
jgi:hypothetical protein